METVQDTAYEINAESKVKDTAYETNGKSNVDNGDFSNRIKHNGHNGHSNGDGSSGYSTQITGHLSRANKILEKINKTRNNTGSAAVSPEKPPANATAAQVPADLQKELLRTAEARDQTAPPAAPFPADLLWGYGAAPAVPNGFAAAHPEAAGGVGDGPGPEAPEKAEVPAPAVELPIADKMPDALPIGRPLPAYPPTAVQNQQKQVWLRNARMSSKQDVTRPGMVRDGCSRDRDWGAPGFRAYLGQNEDGVRDRPAGRSSQRSKREKPVKPQPLPQTFDGVKLQNEEPDPQKIHIAVDRLGRRFVVLMIHRCGRGPGMLPVTGFTGEIVWLAPPDIHITLTKYMHQFLGYFTGESWEDRIVDVFDGSLLPRYQCAVKESDWRLAWDTLQEPFIVMCAAYRRILGGKSAPHLRFGVPPRSVEDKAPSSAPDSTSVAGESLAGFENGINGNGVHFTANGMPNAADFAVGMRANLEMLSQVDTGIAAHLFSILASTPNDVVNGDMQRHIEELHKQFAGTNGDAGPLGVFPFDASSKNFMTAAGTSMLQTSLRPEQPFLRHYQAVPPNS